MGGNISKQAFIISHQKLLSQLCGPEPIDIADPFWTNLGNFPAQLSGLSPEEVQNILNPYWQQLIINSRLTHNFQKLIVRITGSVNNVIEQDQIIKAANGICFLKYIIKYLLETLNGNDFIHFFEGQSTDFSHSRLDKTSLIYKLISCVLEVIEKGEYKESNYVLYLESMQLLIVLLSSQLYCTAIPPIKTYNIEIEMIMNKKEMSAMIIQNILDIYVKRPSIPKYINIYNKLDNNGNSSVFRFVRYAAVSFIILPYTAYKYFIGKNTALQHSPLADTAQLLLIILITYPNQLQFRKLNPYLESIQNLRDLAYFGGGNDDDATVVKQRENDYYEINKFKNVYISYNSFYEAIGLNLVDERSTLILYMLLQWSTSFKEYVMSRCDLETLLLPLCKQAYQVSSASQSQKYLLMIIFLIISQDISLSQNMHKINIMIPDWYLDKTMADNMTLGSFLILILIKQLHYNLTHAKDIYLHTNIIAALANVMGSATNLSLTACQKIIALIQLLCKKYGKARMAALNQNIDNDENTAMMMNESQMSVQFMGGILRIILEIVNGILIKDVTSNIELVYIILQKQDVLLSLEKYPQFNDLFNNIKMTILYFNAQIDQSKSSDNNSVTTLASAEKVREKIHIAARSWRKDKLSVLPELRFQYEEEESAEQFFIPLVWTLVAAFSDIPWKMEMITLFDSRAPSESTLDSEDTLKLCTSTTSSNDHFDV